MFHFSHGYGTGIWKTGSPMRCAYGLAAGDRQQLLKKPSYQLVLGNQKMLTCQVCGKMNTEDARFCFGCGSPLSRGPPVKVDIKSPLTGAPTAMPSTPSIYTPRQVPRPGTCYYHPELPSSFVCARCGRSICAGCNKPYGMLSFCPECFWGLAPKIGNPVPPYPPAYQQPQDSRNPFF